MTAITLQGLRKHYGSAVAVEDVDLLIRSRELFFLLGPSGCGKTTLLRLIAGFIEPTAGSIRFGERDVTRLPPNRRNAGMVFQNYALWPHMTVAENVAYGLNVRRVPASEREQRVQEALRLVQMQDYARRRPGQLSGGQQQRIALARALVFEPELVLMDEPLGALDKQLREHMQFEITNLAHQLGITVVYVTHDQTEALTMSDRVAVFNDGRIQQIAPPDELYESPQNSFVAQFIGENNTLAGTVREIRGGVALVELDDGGVIDAKPVNVSRPGERTTISIRPERVEVDTARLGENAHTLKAEVAEFIYMGDVFRTRLKVAGRDDFIIKTRNSADQKRLKPGSQIEIGWLPEDCRALDAI